jgi:hypothetical protein
VSKKDKHAAQLDRIEAKLDDIKAGQAEILAFRDQLNTRIEGLLGGTESALSGPVASLVSGLIRSGAGNGKPKSGAV